MVCDNTQDKTVENWQLKKIKKRLENPLKKVIQNLFSQQSASIIIMRCFCEDLLKKEPHYVAKNIDNQGK